MNSGLAFPKKWVPIQWRTFITLTEMAQFLVASGLTDLQKAVCQLRLSGMTYARIVSTLPEIKYHRQISSCLTWAAAGFPWNTESEGGRRAYLCPEDEHSLADIIAHAQENLIPLTIPRLIEEAQAIKQARNRAAREFLAASRSLDLLTKFPIADVEFPSRSWVNWFSQRSNLRLKYSQGVDRQRISYGTAEAISHFYDNFEMLIRSFPPQMIFVADETMIDATRGAKCIAAGSKAPITVDDDHLPHISAMLANNLIGAVLPPFLILPHHSTRMPEFEDLTATGRAWICTTPNACETRQSFLLWAICFCHWVNSYRATCQPAISDVQDCLLVLDGHTSRACPTALELLQLFHVHLLILPSHTSHICQFFDIGLASPLKHAIKNHLNRLSRTVDRYGFANATVKVRWLLVNALVDAWYQIVTPDLCRAVAAMSGLFPYSVEEVLNNPKVISEEIAARFRILRPPRHLLNINAELITTPEKIQEIAASIGAEQAHSLRGFTRTIDYRTEIRRIGYGDEIGTILHSTLPPLARHPNDRLELNCPMGFHCLPRTSRVCEPTEFAEAFDLFLRSGAFPGGALEDHVTLIAHIRIFSENAMVKGMLIAGRSIVLVQNTKASPTCRISAKGLSNHLKLVKRCLCPNVMMLPALMTARTTGELHFVYPWYAEYRLSCTLSSDYFRRRPGHIAAYGHQMACALRILEARRIVHTNLNFECWLLTSKNELRLTDFNWAQDAGRSQSELCEGRRFHRYAAPEILVESTRLTCAADVWGFGCILFEMLTGEPLFTSSCETATAILATIGQFIGDPPDGVLASLKGSMAYSHLFRQTKRVRPQESRFASRLPLEFRELGPLFEAIFRWNPDERISINAASGHPFLRDACRYWELPVLTLPETGMTALAPSQAHPHDSGESQGLVAVPPARSA